MRVCRMDILLFGTKDPWNASLYDIVLSNRQNTAG